jgi:hypothetical protein
MSARFTVTRIAGDRELSDQEVLDILRRQMRYNYTRGCEMEISVKATEAQVDKAMQVLMARVGKHEIQRIHKHRPLA